MSAPIDLRPNKHVTWAFLLAEWVLACLFHELYVRCLQTQVSLILRRPRSCPLYDGIAGHVLDVPWQCHTFLVLPTPRIVLVDLDFEAVGREGAAQGFGSWLVRAVFPCPDHFTFLFAGLEHEVYAAALAPIIGCRLKTICATLMVNDPEAGVTVTAELRAMILFDRYNELLTVRLNALLLVH